MVFIVVTMQCGISTAGQAIHINECQLITQMTSSESLDLNQLKAYQ